MDLDWFGPMKIELNNLIWNWQTLNVGNSLTKYSVVILYQATEPSPGLHIAVLTHLVLVLVHLLKVLVAVWRFPLTKTLTSPTIYLWNFFFYQYVLFITWCQWINCINLAFFLPMCVVYYLLSINFLYKFSQVMLSWCWQLLF